MSELGFYTQVNEMSMDICYVHYVGEVIADFIVLGEPAAKSNQRRLVKVRGQYRIIKSAKALRYVKGFKDQCPKLDPPAEGDVSVWVDVWYASRRPDLSIELILDALQGSVIKNDRQVKEFHARHHLSKEKPRAHIIVTSWDVSISGEESLPVGGVTGHAVTPRSVGRHGIG